MSKTVLVATEKPFAKAAVDGIHLVVDAAGYILALLENYSDKAQLCREVASADALIVRSDKVDADVLAAGEKLRIVVRAGAGYDNVDCDTASARNVVVMNTPGQNANAVAELAFGMMLNLARKNYSGAAGTELLGKVLGLHAYGNIGKRVAAIGKGFGMNVKAFDPFVDAAAIEADGVEVVSSVEDLYGECDYVSVHIPSNEQTRKSIDRSLLSRMKTGAVLVNTARKDIIDEDALIAAVTDDDSFCYGADLAPNCLETLKAKMGNRLFVTPKKLGAQTAEANINAGIAAARQIVDFFENGNTKFKVN